MIIAVDFDGTIVEHRYPEIGKERSFAISTLKKLQEDGHELILWTVREGKLLDDAVEWCRSKGLEFVSVNTNFIEETADTKAFSRKLKADLFIDDRNLGGFPGWSNIYQIIKEGKTFSLNYDIIVDAPKVERKKKSFFARLFS